VINRTTKKRKHLPNICNQCGINLGQNSQSSGEAASAIEISKARQVRDLLASDFFHAKSKNPNQTGLPKFLKGVAEKYMDGNQAALARYLSMPKGMIHGWLHESYLPSLSNVHVIAEAFGCRIRDVITGNSESTSLQGRLGLPITRTYRVKTLKDWEAIREQLKCPTEINRGPISSIASIARAYSVDRRSIIQRFPRESAALISLRTRWIREMKEQQHKRRMALIRTIVEQLVSHGIYPSRRKVQACLRGSFAIFSPEMKEACQHACEKALDQLMGHGCHRN
jgi:hypothetical protein